MAEVYEMMMKLGLHNAALTGLTAVAYKLGEIHTLSNKIGGSTGFGGWEGALKGAVAIFAGGVIISGLEKMLMKAKDFSAEMATLQALGGDMAEAVKSGEMKTKAFDISKRVGMKVEDLEKIAGFAYSILGQKDTMEAWEELAKYSVTQRNDQGFMSNQKEAIRNLLKAGTITGRITDPTTGDIDMKKLHDFLDEAQRIKSTTHGAVNEAVLLGMAKQGGPFLRGLSQEGIESMAILAQSLGGPRAGTAFLGVYQQLARGQMTKKTAEGMEAAGLLKPEEWTNTKAGVILDPEASKRLTGRFGGDPLELAREMREDFVKRGITDPQEQMRLTSGAFGRQTTQRFMAEEIADYQQMIGERGRLKKGYGVDESFDVKMQKDVVFNLERLQNAWHNLMVAIADPQSEAFIKVLQSITNSIHGMQDAVKDVDPNTLTFITKGLAGLGIALMAGGMVAVIAAIGPAGWLIGAFAALAAINWDKLKGIANFVQTMSGALKWIDQNTQIKGGPVPWLADKMNKLLPWGGAAPVPATPVPVIPLPNLTPSLPTVPTVPTLPKQPDGDDMKKFFLPTNFSPGEKKQILQPIQMNLNMDGRTLAQAVTEILEDLTEHATGSPNYNGQSHFGRADGGIMGT